MAVRFVLGRAGTGKTRHLRDDILQLLEGDPLGPPIYLLVPAQATLDHERQYGLHWLPEAGFDGFARLRVTDFENLGDDLLAESGGEAVTRVTALGRQLLLGHLLRTRQDKLHYFRSTARQVGLIGELDRTFTELDRAGLDPGDLLEQLDAADASDATLDKARDLALLGDAYRKALGDRDDATARFARVIDSVPLCPHLTGVHLRVDGFMGFSAAERRLLVALAIRCASVTVALTLDPDDEALPLFERTRETFERLQRDLREAKIAVEPPVRLGDTRRFTSRALQLVERDWSSPRPATVPGDDAAAIRMIETPGPRAQADAAARQVLDWVQSGLRLRECVVLSRNLANDQPLLEAAFREHGLAYFIDRRRPARHHPLVRFVRSLLRVAQFGWPHEAVIQLIKCAVAGLSPDEADLLENYVVEHRIRGRRAWTDVQPWSARYEPPAPDDSAAAPINEDAAVADQLRLRLAEAIDPLTARLREGGRFDEIVEAVHACMRAFGTEDAVGHMIEAAESAGDFEAASEHRQAWETVGNMLAQASELLGEESMTGRDFLAVLDYGLDLAEFAVTPATADAVILGDVERTRVLNCRACVVIGLSDTIFPQPAVDDTVLGDDDRRTLRQRDIDLDPPTDRQQLRETLLAYQAFTRASDRLTLVRPVTSDDSSELSESVYWTRIRSMFDLGPHTVERTPAADDLATPRQVVSRLLVWTRDGGNPADEVAPLYDVLRDATPKSNAPLATLRDQAWPSLLETNRPTLTTNTIRQAFGDTLDASVSRLEMFAACPFHHYAAHLLKLRHRDEDDVTPRDLGILYHGVLQRLVRQAIVEKMRFLEDEGDAERLRDMTGPIAKQVGEQLRGGLLTSSPRYQHLLDRIERTTRQLLDSQRRVLQLGVLQPAHTELEFGRGDGSLPPLSTGTPGGRRVNLYGQIDRVDVSPDGRFAAVVDYKLGGRRLALGDVYYGLAMQLLTYLAVLENGGDVLGSRSPAPIAAFYVRLLSRFEKHADPDDAPSRGEPAFDLREPPRGIVSYEAMPLLDPAFAGDDEHHAVHQSAAFNLRTKNDGQPYTNSDAVTTEDFDTLLQFVREKIAKLGDAVLDGDIDVRPLRVGKVAQCRACEFASVCRFDPARDGYRFVPRLSDQEALVQIGGGS